MKRKILVFCLVALIAVVAGIAFYGYRDQTPPATTEPGPELNFSLPDLQDVPQSIAQWRGKILLVNFWATWCPPCLKEIPEFVKLQAEYQDRGVQFVGIALEDKQPVLDYQSQVKVNYPLLIGGEDAAMLAQRLGNLINTVPFTVIVDPQGKIVHRQLGELSREKILEVIEPLLQPN
ncbi:TlpA disulfide reductase family protein [Methylomonas koyamae]|uniref:TlpA family protein disulfide reductase n=1 Tax=Methylomonas koyamae TaxID=702114 RepID=UPI0016427D63|nr:TlpA disulfide reductase family protein [Methylomonas koyamae]